MSVNAIYFLSNLFFAIANYRFALYGPYPRFSALCFGICTGATFITGYNWIVYG